MAVANFPDGITAPGDMSGNSSIAGGLQLKSRLSFTNMPFGVVGQYNFLEVLGTISNPTSGLVAPAGFYFGPTIQFHKRQINTTAPAFYAQPTYQPMVGNLAIDLSSTFGGFVADVTYSPANLAGTNATPLLVGYWAAFTASTASTGTATITDVNAFHLSGWTVNTGVVWTTARGLRIPNPTGGGTITDLIGIDLAALTKGSTSNTAIRSAGATADMRFAGPGVFGANAPPTTGGTMQWGTHPGEVPTVGAAGNVNTGAHQYKVTYVSAAGETLPSIPSSIVNPGVASQISVPIPVGPSGTTGRNVYRTKVGGTTYFLITTSPVVNNNTATAYTDNTADASLTATTPPTSDTSSIAPSCLEGQGVLRAVLLPRMSTAQKDAIPALTGMMLFDITLAAVQIFENGAWKSL